MKIKITEVKMKYLLKIRYCGSAYAGFQVQKNADTVQAELMSAANRIFGARCTVTGCSRTDSGVHALEYYATLLPPECSPEISAEKLPRALMSALPCDIVVTDAFCVDEKFSVRRAVTGKRYMYLLFTKSYMDPFYIGRAWHYPRHVDTEKMNAAASYLCGKHDFASFMASGSFVKNTVRNITECRVEESGDGFVKIFIAADGFLYNMVRIIVGTLVYVNEGKILPEQLDGIILSRDRTLAGKTAPADGLYLEKVFIKI